MHTIDKTFVELNAATFTGAIVRTIGTLDPSAPIHVRGWPTAVTTVSGPKYPYNHVLGLCHADTIEQIYADYPTSSAPFVLDCAPDCHHAADVIAFRGVGLAPVSTSAVFVYDATAATPRIPRSNLVWSVNEYGEASTDYLPSDEERVVRQAYALQPDSAIVSLLHSDGIIASAGIRVAEGYAFCFGAWVAPHRRRRGHYATLLDARLHYAHEHGCHTVVLHTQTRSAVASAAEERGFRVGWTRQRWMEVHPRGKVLV